MHAVRVEAVFSAAHALVIGGELERLHGHDWRVEVVLVGGDLDADGLLVDFHAVEAELAAVIAPFRNANLNEVTPFGRAGAARPELNPSAERVAEWIARGLSDRLETRGVVGPKTKGGAKGAAGSRSAEMARGAAGFEGGRAVWIESVSVTEAPGCRAEYRPERRI